MAQTYNNSYQTEKNKKKSESMLSLLFPLQRQWCSLEDTTNTTAEKENCTRMYVRFDEFLSVGFSSSQCPRVDLNKKSLPRPKTTAA